MDGIQTFLAFAFRSTLTLVWLIAVSNAISSFTCFSTPLKTFFFLRIIGLEPTNSAWKADVITISPNSRFSFVSLLFFLSLAIFHPFPIDSRFSFLLCFLSSFVFLFGDFHPFSG
jgi:hypothetical protein